MPEVPVRALRPAQGWPRLTRHLNTVAGFSGLNSGSCALAASGPSRGAAADFESRERGPTSAAGGQAHPAADGARAGVPAACPDCRGFWNVPLRQPLEEMLNFLSLFDESLEKKGH